MLVGTELAKESEEYVQGFYYWLSILQLVHWDVTHRADDLSVVSNVHINLRAWEWSCLEGLLHLWVPLLH